MGGDNRPDVPTNPANEDREPAYGPLQQAGWPGQDQQQPSQGQPRTWSRSDGLRYFDPRPTDGQGNTQSNPGPDVNALQQRDISIGNGLSVRQYANNPNMVDIIDSNGRIVSREAVRRGQGPVGQGNQPGQQYQDISIRNPTNRQVVIEIMRFYPDHTIGRIDPNNNVVFETIQPDGARDHFDNNGRLADRVYPNGVRDIYSGGEYPTERQYPDGSYERYDAQGRVQETRFNNYVTRYDTFGRKTDVAGPNQDTWRFDYAADGGPINSYEVTRGGQVVERGNRTPGGTLAVERRQQDGSFAVEPTLNDRYGVVLRPDLTLDYLDREGYGLPDQHGRRIKRDDRTVMGARQLEGGRVEQVPVNPIRSIRMPDGRTFNYEYTSDGLRASGPDELKAYTIRNARGEVTEFGARVPSADPTRQRAMWLEYKARPGQAPISDAAMNEVRDLVRPGTPQEMIDRQRRLVQNRPLLDYMPTQAGQETTGVRIDQITGQQFNDYGNGDSLLRDVRGGETTTTARGDRIVRSSNGTEVRTAWDANRNIQGDRTTVTEPTGDGRMRLRFHHSRSDNSKVAFSYADNGTSVTQVITERADGSRTRLVRDPAIENRWVEERLTTAPGGAPEWQTTANRYNMSVELVGPQSTVRLSNRPLPPGSIVMTNYQNNRALERRIVTPQGIEIVGRVTDGGDQTLPVRIFETPRPAQGQPGGPTRRQQPSEYILPGTPGTPGTPPAPGQPQERQRTQVQERSRR